jgi:hypothetical protein
LIFCSGTVASAAAGRSGTAIAAPTAVVSASAVATRAGRSVCRASLRSMGIAPAANRKV